MRLLGLLLLAGLLCAGSGDGLTALHTAALENDLDGVRLLLRRGANPNAVTRVGEVTPLELACMSGNTEVVEALLKAGANPKVPAVLMKAAASGSAKTVLMLLEHGTDVNTKEPARGQTALMFAAGENRAEVIR